MRTEDFTEYLLGQDRADKTMDGYQRDLIAFATWFEQTYDRSPESAAVTPLDLRAYKKHLTDVKQMKPASINRRLAALRAYFRWAKQQGLVVANPTDGIRDVPQTAHGPGWLDRKQAFYLSQAATAAIQLAEARGLIPSAHLARRDAAIFSILLNAGLRVSELCALRLKDITLNERRGWVVVRSGKGSKYREIPLNKDARQAIHNWLEVRPKNAGDYLFLGRRQEPLQPRGVQRAVERLALAAHLDAETITPHTLRHTFGKNLVDAGVSLDRVAMLLGHESLDTTAVYTTPSKADLTAAVEQVAWTEE